MSSSTASALDPGTATARLAARAPLTPTTDCFPASESLLVRVTGCAGGGADFDGPSYLKDWPGTGSPRHDARYDPQPIMFTSPVFNGFQRYSQVAFETDLPRVEYPDFGGDCNYVDRSQLRQPAAGIEVLPDLLDRVPGRAGSPARRAGRGGPRSPGGSCVWRFGGPKMPGTARNFGGSSATEYSQHLLRLLYPSVNGSGQPAPEFMYEDFRNVLANPC